VRHLIVLLVLLAAQPAQAGVLELDGRLIQGGLVFGTTEPDAEVILGDRRVRVSPQGRFLFGLGREAPAEATLYVRFADGSRMQRSLRIEKRTYKIQRIDGLPRKMVNFRRLRQPADPERRAQAAALRR
jgi:hypothetical protein